MRNRLSVQQTFDFREKLAALIAGENRLQPYSDIAVVKIMQPEFPHVTQVSVDYHRRVLKIPGAPTRRRRNEEVNAQR